MTCCSIMCASSNVQCSVLMCVVWVASIRTGRHMGWRVCSAIMRRPSRGIDAFIITNAALFVAALSVGAISVGNIQFQLIPFTLCLSIYAIAIGIPFHKVSPSSADLRSLIFDIRFRTSDFLF